MKNYWKCRKATLKSVESVTCAVYKVMQKIELYMKKKGPSLKKYLESKTTESSHEVSQGFEG